MPGGFGTSKGRKSVYSSLVSPLDRNPGPKYKPYLHMKNDHGRLFVIDLEAAQNSLVFHTANGSVLFHDTVPPDFLTKFINQKGSRKNNVKKENQHQRRMADATAIR